MTRNYDSKCEDLARYFIDDPGNHGFEVTAQQIADLAQCIQDRIEDWMDDHDRQVDERGQQAREGEE